MMEITGPAEVSIRAYGDPVETHSHDFHQIVLPRRGVMEIEIDGQGGYVHGAAGALVPAEARHAFAADPSSRFLVVDIALDHPLLRNGEDFLRRQAFFAISPQIGSLLDYAAPIDFTAPDKAVLAGAWTALLLAALGMPRHEDRDSRALAAAMGYMAGNFARSISVADIAAAAGVSQRGLYRLFETERGCSPYQSLTDLRLRHAVDLIGVTRLSIAEIAHRTGFADQSALTKALRRGRGTTPGAVRRAQASGFDQ